MKFQNTAKAGNLKHTRETLGKMSSQHTHPWQCSELIMSYLQVEVQSLSQRELELQDTDEYWNITLGEILLHF